MRDFSDEFLEHYLATAGDGILASVGAYRLEEMGIQLFENIDGDQTTILGLPLLPLFGFLRSQNLLAG
jgi:septum formation protein